MEREAEREMGGGEKRKEGEHSASASLAIHVTLDMVLPYIMIVHLVRDVSVLQPFSF